LGNAALKRTKRMDWWAFIKPSVVTATIPKTIRGPSGKTNNNKGSKIEEDTSEDRGRTGGGSIWRGEGRNPNDR